MLLHQPASGTGAEILPADEADFVAGGGAPALGMAGVVVDAHGMLAHCAGDDRFRVPLAQKLDQDALADFGQGVEAVVGGGFALSVGRHAAAVGRERVQPGAGAGRLRVERLPLELDLDAPLLLGVMLVCRDVRPDGARVPARGDALGVEGQGQRLEPELLGGSGLLLLRMLCH